MDDFQKHLEELPQRYEKARSEEKRNRDEITKALKQEAREKQEECNKLKNEVEDLRKQKSQDRHRYSSEQRDSAQSNSRELELKRAQRDLEETRRELDETKSRLSKQMGHKLTDGNPDIADLSDKNRPTKLAERYSELYDNEWTNAFEMIDNDNEKKTVEILLQVVFDAFDFCRKESVDQMTTIQKAFVMSGKMTGVPDTVKKQLKDCRKALGDTSAKHTCEKYLQELRDSYSDTAKRALSVKEFVRVCVEIAWFMSIQDPPLVFGKVPRHGDTFNTDVYRAYTSTGLKVDFIVWPALLLHENGPVLCKGVAQGCGESKRERLKQDNLERSRTADDKALYRNYRPEDHLERPKTADDKALYNKHRPDDHLDRPRTSADKELYRKHRPEDHFERPKTADDKALYRSHRSEDYNYQQRYKPSSYESEAVQTRHMREDNSRRHASEPSAYGDYEYYHRKVTPYQHKPTTYEQTTITSRKRYDDPTQYEMDEFLRYSKKYEHNTRMLKLFVGEETYKKCTRFLENREL